MCEDCGPVDHPLHGDDEEHHCPGCDRVVRWENLPEEARPDYGRNYKIVPAKPKARKVTPQESAARTREGKKILAGMKKRNEGGQKPKLATTRAAAKKSEKSQKSPNSSEKSPGPSAADMRKRIKKGEARCQECAKGFAKQGKGQANRTSCYECKPRKPGPGKAPAGRGGICALRKCQNLLPPGDARRRFCAERHKRTATNRRTNNRRLAQRARAPREPKKLDEAVEWLRARLERGNARAGLVIEEAGTAGHSRTTIHGATKVLGILRESREGNWWWRLPEAPDHGVGDDEESPARVLARAGAFALRGLARALDQFAGGAGRE